MAAIGIGLVWMAYTAGLYGYCLFRGYDVTPKDLLSPNWPPGNVAAEAGKAGADALNDVGNKVKKT